MRYILASFILSCFPAFVFGQWVDSFNYSGPPSLNGWISQSGDFEINTGKLHSINNFTTAHYYGISHQFDFSNVNFFDIDIEFKANPSSLNYVDIFLGCDTIVESCRNGYFIRFGDTKDKISFWKLCDSVATELISGPDGELNKSTNSYHMRLHRTNDNHWQLFYGLSGNNFIFASNTIADTTFFHSRFGGIKITQSGSTIIGKHYFDNLSFLPFYPDTIPPILKSFSASTTSQMKLIFSEQITDTRSLNFLLDEGTTPDSISISKGKDSIDLFLYTPMVGNIGHTLFISGLSDTAGNPFRDTTINFFPLFPETPVYGDIIITEVMAKPEPSAGLLPENEYIEIKNTGGKYLRLKNCIFTDGSTKTTLPDTIMKPYEYRLLAKNNSTAWPSGIHTVFTSGFPGLNNDGDHLRIMNSAGELIWELNYKSDWHTSEIKKSGGWSLEMLDTSKYCINDGNWGSNNSEGGTPGMKNSIFNVCKPKDFRCIRIYPAGLNSLRIYLSENPDSSQIHLSDFSIESSNFLKVAYISQFNRTAKYFTLFFNENFVENQIYNLKIKQLTSCDGRVIYNVTIPFGIPVSGITKNNIRINELLFDPVGDDPDYIEIVNCSDSILDLKFLDIANQEQGKISEIWPVYPEGFVLLPGAYLALTTDVSKIISRYKTADSSNLLEIPQTPAFLNDGGEAVLFNTLGDLIDHMYYNPKMHSPVIYNTEGISLEKTNPGLPSDISTYWISASSTCGFGTPGSINSQFGETSLNGDFELKKPYFSPDNDGIDDFLQLSYHLNSQGYHVTSYVFAENGSLVGQIHLNEEFSINGLIEWNGEVNSRPILPGNYVWFFEGFNLTGQKFQKKITFTVLKNGL